jgi:hypothetical protein
MAAAAAAAEGQQVEWAGMRMRSGLLAAGAAQTSTAGYEAD